jgi:hypothetical protein
MSGAKERLLHEALGLPEEERAELAAELLASLGPEDTRTDEEWLAQIERRARSALQGSPGIPWEEARAELEREFGRF